MSVKSELNVYANRYGWRFFLKPEGLELFFLNTWNLSLLSFFLFFVLNIQSECSCLIGFNLKDWQLIWKMVVFGKGIKFFGWMKKPNQKIKMLFIRPKNFILFLGFDFWGCLKVSWQSQCSVSRKMSYKNGKHLQKTMHHTTECDVAVAQVRVSFFICLLGCFWLL